MNTYYIVNDDDELYHHGILGQKWGVRRFQNEDGSLTEAGRKRYGSGGRMITDMSTKDYKRYVKSKIDNSSDKQQTIEIERNSLHRQQSDLKNRTTNNARLASAGVIGLSAAGAGVTGNPALLFTPVAALPAMGIINAGKSLIDKSLFKKKLNELDKLEKEEQPKEQKKQKDGFEYDEFGFYRTNKDIKTRNGKLNAEIDTKPGNEAKALKSFNEYSKKINEETIYKKIADSQYDKLKSYGWFSDSNVSKEEFIKKMKMSEFIYDGDYGTAQIYVSTPFLGGHVFVCETGKNGPDDFKYISLEG